MAIPGWLWLVLLAASLGVGALLFDRSRRADGAGRATDRGGPATDLARLVPGSADERSTEDIWAAAALLGEAVDRLRQRRRPEDVGQGVGAGAGALTTQGGDAPGITEPGNDLDAEDLFVVEGLDDEDSASLASAAASPALPVPTGPIALPLHVTCRLRPRDVSAATGAIQVLLRADPRVLRRPEPSLRDSGGELLVSFAVLPGLPPGERSVLEQRLRDCVA